MVRRIAAAGVAALALATGSLALAAPSQAAGGWLCTQSERVAGPGHLLRCWQGPGTMYRATAVCHSDWNGRTYTAYGPWRYYQQDKRDAQVSIAYCDAGDAMPYWPTPDHN